MTSTITRVIKFSYHFIAFILLLYLALTMNEIHKYIRIALILFAGFHLYDAWWFYKYSENAPI